METNTAERTLHRRTLRYLSMVGENDAASLLEKTPSEEKETDQKLTQLAEGINAHREQIRIRRRDRASGHQSEVEGRAFLIVRVHPAYSRECGRTSMLNHSKPANGRASASRFSLSSRVGIQHFSDRVTRRAGLRGVAVERNVNGAMPTVSPRC